MPSKYTLHPITTGGIRIQMPWDAEEDPTQADIDKYYLLNHKTPKVDTPKSFLEMRQNALTPDESEPTTFLGGFGRSLKKQLVDAPSQSDVFQSTAHPQSLSDIAPLLLPSGVPSVGKYVKGAIGSLKNSLNGESNLGSRLASEVGEIGGPGDKTTKNVIEQYREREAARAAAVKAERDAIFARYDAKKLADNPPFEDRPPMDVVADHSSFKQPSLPDIERITKQPETDILGKIGNWNNKFKSSAMTTGVPYTGLNPHGFNIAYNRIKDNPANTYDAFRDIISPKGNRARLALEGELAPTVQKLEQYGGGGGEFGSTGHTGIFGEKVSQAFGGPTFDYNIPKAKAVKFQGDLAKMMEMGMPEYKAGPIAAQAANEFFGGSMAKVVPNATNRKVLRALMFAPDFQVGNLAANYKGIKALGDLTNPANVPYRRQVMNTALLKGLGAGAGGLMAGEAMSDNPRYPLNVETGLKDDKNKDISLKGGLGMDDTYATAAKLAESLYYQEPKLAADAILGKIGPVPALAKDAYDFTQAFPNSRKNPHRRELKFLDQIAFSGLPGPARAALDYSLGRKGELQSASESVGLPFNFEIPVKKKKRRGY